MADETAPSQRTVLGQSRIFTPEVINDIHMKAELGLHVDVVDDLLGEDPASPEDVSPGGCLVARH